MTFKKRIVKQSNTDAIENLANELADKPYGQESIKKDIIKRITITLPESTLIALEDIAIMNKRQSKTPSTVSALIRYCINKQLEI